MTLFLTGELVSVLLLAIVLTWPVCWVLLGLYRRAVRRSMASRASTARSGTESASRTAAAIPDSAATNTVVTVDASAAAADRDADSALHQDLLTRPWRVAQIYGLAALAYAAILGLVTGWLAEPAAPFRPLRFLLLTMVFGWPVVPTLAIVAGSVRRWKVAIASLYTVVFLALSVIATWGSPESSVGQAVLLWALYNGPSLVLLWLCLSRRIRAVGPLVLVFLILGFLGTHMLLSVIGSSDARMRGAVTVGDWFGLGAVGTLVGTVITGFIVFAIVGAALLWWIRRRYEAKQLSDESLTIHTIWWMYVYSHAIGLAFEHPLAPVAGLGAMAAFIVVTRVGFARATSGGTGPKLLLLRSFSIGPAGERLFDALEKHWRRVGSIQMIAGEDLATRTIEPHEFLDFIARKLARRFIDGEATLRRRLDEMDLRPDRDGRFRVNDFFCYDDTWRVVLSSLVRESDAVLMDLRGFSRRNAGCVFEIGELFRLVPLERVLFVVDGATDRPFLDETFARASAMVSGGGRSGTSRLNPRLFMCATLDARSFRGLLRALAMAAGRGPAEAGKYVRDRSA